jgi:hypothetical protein
MATLAMLLHQRFDVFVKRDRRRVSGKLGRSKSKEQGNRDAHWYS